MVLPTPAAVAGVTMSWYGDTELQVDQRSNQQAQEKLASGAMVHQLQGTLTDNITTYNDLINNQDGDVLDVLTEENKLQKVVL